jgi:hypothetical protein
MNLTNIAILLVAVSCILNAINIGILRRDNSRIWADLIDITEALNNLAKEKDKK